MTNEEFVKQLSELVQAKQQHVPDWLLDLLNAGPRFEQWPAGHFSPNRVILTEFLARWLKAVGFSHEECLQWLEPYCCQILKQYAKSGMSAVRHGTKCNIRWVYNSDFHFDFEAMAKGAPEPGLETSAPYMSVFSKWWTALGQEKQRERDLRRAAAEAAAAARVPLLPVKKRFQEQYEKGLAIARQKRAEGMGLEEVVRLLNEQGLLSRTGRPWTATMLHQRLRIAAVEQALQSSGSSAPSEATPEPSAT